jgi:hypothetical protein
MEGLRRALLEDPLYIYIALGFAELALAVVWHEKRTGRAMAALVIPPVLAVAVWALAAAVVTDREEIIAATGTIARDVEAGSVSAAEEYLDDDCGGFGGSKEGLLDAARAAMKAYPIKKVGFTRVEVTVEEDRAAMHLGTMVTLEGGKQPVAWDLQWIKRPAGWRIIEVSEPQTKLEL